MVRWRWTLYKTTGLCNNMKNSKFWEAVYVDPTPAWPTSLPNLNSAIFFPLKLAAWGASEMSAGRWPVHMCEWQPNLVILYTYLFILCVWIFYLHVYICVTCMVPDAHKDQKKESIRSPGSSCRDSCSSPCGDWESSMGPLQEQRVWLTAEYSLQPPKL